jgi:protein SCO1/2
MTPSTRWILAAAPLVLTLQSTELRAQDRPAALRDVGIDQKLNEQVPLDLTFRDESGKTVKLADYFGKRPVILAPVYYECPMLCTLTLNGLTFAMKKLPFTVGREFEVVTVSFNPRETPALAAKKKENYLRSLARPGAEAGWHFLTGDEAPVQQLMRAIGFRYKWDAETRQYAHAAGLMVLTPQGRLARYFYGVEFPVRDLRLALVEASANKIGSPVDQVLLFCFHYDPATGKYNVIVGRIVQIGGVVTVLALATLMTVLLWRERQARPSREGGATG